MDASSSSTQSHTTRRDRRAIKFGRAFSDRRQFHTYDAERIPCKFSIAYEQEMAFRDACGDGDDLSDDFFMLWVCTGVAGEV